MNIILEGIVGSTAYGLAHKDSDIDKKGIFVFDTEDLFGLNYRTMKDVVETHAPEPDNTWYEAAKWCNLALKCNPNILELVFLPNDLYTVKTDVGEMLREIRSSFLSAPAVRNSYINYARSQLHKIEGTGNFGSDLKKRTAKHARHLIRLMMQGYQLYTTGDLTVRLGNLTAMQVRAIGDMTAEGDLIPLKELYEKYKESFEVATPVIPEVPDKEAVESWLKYVRQRFL
jgi:predicted nucleotidyltransferase